MMNTPRRGGAPKVTKPIYDKLGIVKEEEMAVSPK